MSAAVYRPTHTVPAGGLPTWSTPDATQPATGRVDPWLEVQVVQSWGQWANIQCSNGWTAWVDGGALRPIGAPPPPAPASMGAASAPVSRNAMVIGLIGAGLVFVGSFLPWLSIEGAADFNAFHTPVDFLWSIDAVTEVDAQAVSVGGLLVLLALGIGALAVAQRGSVARLVGAAAAVVCVLYVIELVRSLNEAPDAPGVFSVLGFGVYVALAGGLVALVAGGRR